MLIQCQTCNSKYRLNLERIPNRKTFIKCKKCNAPIYIDPQEEAGESGSILHPGPAGREDGGKVVVHCDRCSARYRVPTAPLRKPGLKLKCTRCGHQFPVPEDAVAHLGEPEAGPPPVAGEQGAAPDFFPAAASAGEPLEGGAPGGEMPLPDDAHLESMFDDLQVDAEVGGQGGPSLEGASPESEQAYLEAVSFDDSGAFEPPGQGSIPDEQKYRFFLKPREGGEADEEEEEGLPPLPDEPEGEPPSLSGHDGAAEAAAAGEAGAEALPPFESEFPEETGMADTPDLDATLPPLVVDEPTQQERIHNENRAVPGQDPTHSRQEDRNFWSMVAVVAVVLVVAAGWGFWIWNLPTASRAYTVREGNPAQLPVTKTRQGYFITNKPSGQRLFVMTGQVVNRFPARDRVGWVRLKGIAYTDGAQTQQEGFAYVGNLLNDDQLATWDLNAIRAYYGYTNGRNDANVDIPQGKNVPYQIVLRGVRNPVPRTETKVVSYMRQGRPVYLEHF